MVISPLTASASTFRLTAFAPAMSLLWPKAKEMLVIKSALVSNERMQVPAWLEVDIEKLQGNVLSLPQPRPDRFGHQRGQLIVELYSSN